MFIVFTVAAAMSKALLNTGIVVAVMACSHVSVAASKDFNIGPYRIGMTNAEASKPGLSNCEPDSIKRFMECDGQLPGEYFKYPIKLYFDMKTKRLERMTATFRDWRSDDERIPAMRAALNLGQCPAESLSPMEDWYSKEKCYVRPDQYRSISWDPGKDTRRATYARSITVGVVRNSVLVKNFFDTKQAAVNQARRNSEFARGR